jgi:hypothetical protein
MNALVRINQRCGRAVVRRFNCIPDRLGHRLDDCSQCRIIRLPCQSNPKPDKAKNSFKISITVAFMARQSQSVKVWMDYSAVVNFHARPG